MANSSLPQGMHQGHLDDEAKARRAAKKLQHEKNKQEKREANRNRGASRRG